MINQLKNEQSNVLTNSLNGMQSVRATFPLSKNTINMLSTVANQLGVKEKSIFDHLVENRNLLYQVLRETKKGISPWKQKNIIETNGGISLLRPGVIEQGWRSCW